jgi:uncharacterized protein
MTAVMSADAEPRRTRIRRKPERAAYDWPAIHAILDAALICHVGVARKTSPVVLPTIHARVGEMLYLHGSPAAGLIGDCRDDVTICVTATIVDGLVLARSARYHSVNYRSAVVLGSPRLVAEPDAKLDALRALVEHVTPGRWAVIRPPTSAELAQTAILELRMQEGSAKIRSGPPAEPAADSDLPGWAGVIPLRTVPGTPVPGGAISSSARPPQLPGRA